MSNTSIGRYHSGTVNLGVMAIKGYSAFPKSPALLKPHHQIVCAIFKNSLLEGKYLNPSAAIQSAYSTALTDWDRTC